MWHSGLHRPSQCRRGIRGLEFRQSVLRLRSFLSLLKLVRYRVEIHKLRAAADIFRRSDSDVFSSFSDALLPIKDARSGGEKSNPGGESELSPALKRWDKWRRGFQVPEGRPNSGVGAKAGKSGTPHGMEMLSKLAVRNDLARNPNSAPVLFPSHFSCTAITDTKSHSCNNSPRVQHRELRPSSEPEPSSAAKHFGGSLKISLKIIRMTNTQISSRRGDCAPPKSARQTAVSPAKSLFM